MSGKSSWLHFPWQSGFSGSSASSDPAWKSARFFLSAVAFYALIYLCWIPLRAPFVLCLAAGAQSIVGLLETPPILTALIPDGHRIGVQSYITGQREVIAAWHSDNLHIFIITSVSLALSVPTLRWKDRLRLAGIALIASTSVTLAICVAQIKAVAATYASTTLGITLYGPVETLILRGANRSLIMVGMILLPVFVFLAGYASSLRPDRSRRRTIRNGRRGWPAGSWFAILIIVWAGGWIALVQPHPVHLEPSGELAGLRHIASQNQTSAFAHFALGFHLEQQGRPDEALQSYDDALALDGSLIKAHFGRGNILFRQGDYRGAASSYDEVLKREPNEVSALYNLANTHFERAQYALAARTYERALTVQEGHASAHKNLGMALMKLDRPCEALPHFARATRLDRRYFSDSELRTAIRQLEDLCVNP